MCQSMKCNWMLLYDLYCVLSGCDTISQFAGRGKVTAWKAFENNSLLLASFWIWDSLHMTHLIALRSVCKNI